MKTVRAGDEGEAVRKLQLLINSTFRPIPRLKPDGAFGPRTAQAVRQFQALSRLKADGVVGADTWRALGVSMPRSAARARVPHVPDAPWLKIAEAEIGVQEDTSPTSHNSRIIEYHQTTTLKATTDEVPWCSSFVNWVMTNAGFTGTSNALASSWLTWGTSVSGMRLGAVTIIRKKSKSPDAATGSTTGNHVGFCVGFDVTHFTLLGGNQRGGRAVAISQYLVNDYDVRGSRWPTA